VSADGLVSIVPLMNVLAASGDQATALVILGSIVIPLLAVAWLCWFFWRHRHDE
jgi:hypothetical protein